MKLDAIIQQLGCQLVCQPATSLTINAVCMDTRTLIPGCLFVAICGEQFDGHDFMAVAKEKGAVAILCERFDSELDVPQLVVNDSILALARIATRHRAEMSCPIIALTGSNGKTTVKEMIALILPEPSLATAGNFNNHIGAPLSVLQLKPHHRYAVFELGANHQGEIAHTVAIVQPNVTLINNIAPAHIEGFGSIEGVARAKGEIYQGLALGGTAIINDDDDFASFWDDLLIDKKIIRFSLTKQTDVNAQSITLNSQGCATFTLVLPTGQETISLAIPGMHSVSNALAAASCCYAAGISITDIAAGLNRFKGVAGRMSYQLGKNQSTVIDDTYNANLRSVLTAIEVLAKHSGYRVLALGDMGELGDWTHAHHEEVGRFAKQQGIDLLVTCGQYSLYSSRSFGLLGRHYDSQEELARDLLSLLNKNTTVLVKGSRSARMEKIVQQLVG